MESNFDIVLSLKENNSNLSLRERIYREELNKVNIKHPINENEVDIKITYFLKNNDSLEVGFFIRNTLESNISLELIPLVIKDEQGNELVSQVFNFKGSGNIPSYSAKPFVVNFVVNHELNLNKEEYAISFGTMNQIKAFNSVDTIIENIPDNITFEEEKDIRDFVNGLQALKVDDFDMSTFKLQYNDSEGIDCFLLFRNGSDKELNLEYLDIYIVGEDNTIIAREEFVNSENVIKISPLKSRLVKFQFKTSTVLNKEYDLSKCKVQFK